MGRNNSKPKQQFSLETIRRLNIYLRNLKRLNANGVEVISSKSITQLLDVTPAQFRKDLSYFGEFGIRGVGYNVTFLIDKIQKIVGTHKVWHIALVGLGKLGSALLGFEGFSRLNIVIKHVFDNDKRKIGKVKNRVKVKPVAHLAKVIKNAGIKIAVIATPPEAAQKVVSTLVGAGITGILNFAPVVLQVPRGVFVFNVDMACELESLIFFCQERKRWK